MVSSHACALHTAASERLEVRARLLKHAELQRKHPGELGVWCSCLWVNKVPLLLHLIYQRGVKPGVSIELKNFLEDLQVAVVHFDA